MSTYKGPGLTCIISEALHQFQLVTLRHPLRFYRWGSRHWAGMSPAKDTQRVSSRGGLEPRSVSLIAEPTSFHNNMDLQVTKYNLSSIRQPFCYLKIITITALANPGSYSILPTSALPTDTSIFFFKFLDLLLMASFNLIMFQFSNVSLKIRWPEPNPTF